jgi:hypothetical protein
MSTFCTWLGSTGVVGGGGVCVPQFEARPPQPNVLPGPGGQFRNFTDTASFDSAWAAAAPGDVLRQTQTFVGRCNAFTGKSGASGNHIKITRVPGVEVIGTNDLNNVGTVDVGRGSFIDVIGMKIRGGQFGLRALSLAGSPASPCQIGWNEVSHTGHAHLAIQGTTLVAPPAWTPSQWVHCIGNNIHSPSPNVTAGNQRRFNEGLYLGYGSEQWVDLTAHIYVGYNEIWDLPSDGIDLKPGVTDVLMELNDIHSISFVPDLGPIAGISIAYGDAPNPIGDLAIEARWNRIWNIVRPAGNTSEVYYNPIIIGQGGVTAYQNAMWEYSTGYGIYIRSEVAFSSATIALHGNTMGVRGYHDDPGNPGPARNINAADNLRGHNTGNTGLGTLAATPADWLGPITGLADHGEGPGSGFFLNPTSVLNGVGTFSTSLSTRCPDTVDHRGALPSLVAP